MSTRSAELPLREVFDQHAGWLKRFVRYVGVGESDVDDVLQELFVVVHRRLPELEDPAKIRAWLRVIALNTVRNFRRARRRRPDRPISQDQSTEPVSSFDPHGDVEARQTRARLTRLLDLLTEDQRTIVVLYEIEQLAMREVAEIVGCPLQTAYSRLSASRALLRRAWEEEEAR